MVYVVAVYDVEADRTRLFLNFLRRYLTHVQNSVFEGEITEGDLEEVKQELDAMLQSGESVILYRVGSPQYISRSVYGEDPTEDSQFL